MLKKINFIFDKKQKIQFISLLFVILLGSCFELIGVSAITPLINLIVDPSYVTTNIICIELNKNFGITSTRDFIIIFSVLLILIYIIKNIYVIFMYSLQYRYTYSNQRKLAYKLMNCYVNQDYLFHTTKNVAELQRNVSEDVKMFYATILNGLQMLTEISVCIILMIFLIIKDFATTLTVVGMAMLFVLYFGSSYKKKLVKLGNRNRISNANLTKWLLQTFGGIKEIKVLDREKYFLNEYDKNYHEFSETFRKQLLLGIMPRPIMETVCICGLLIGVIIKCVSGVDMQHFVLVLSIFAIAAVRMLPSFSRITGNLNVIMFNKTAVDSVYNDLKEVKDLVVCITKEEEFNNRMEFEDEITLKHISFSYPNSSNKVLEDISLSIPKNKSVAFIGPSGAGKTTIADIILGILRPQAGNVKVDGNDIFKNLQAWHKILSYIPQTIYLIDGSIRDNIAFGIPEEEIDKERIEKAVIEAQLQEFVDGLPDGLLTNIGENGVRLSGGQRQRIGIARALYNEPQVLILDEATSALDNDTEFAVMKAIDSLFGNKTLIIIAHRLSTIENCDIVYEVRKTGVVRKK